MHTLHKFPQHATIIPKHTALPFVGFDRNVYVCQLLGYHGAAKAASFASSKMDNSPCSSSNSKIVVLDATDRQNVLYTFRPPQPASDVLSHLEQELGSGTLKASNGVTLLGSETLRAGEYSYGLQGCPILYSNVVVSLPEEKFVPEQVMSFGFISRTTLESVLEGFGVIAVQDAAIKLWQGIDSLELHDNMLLVAARGYMSFDKLVSTLDCFVESSEDLLADATEAVYQRLLKEHSSVKVLGVRELTCADGSKREVGGVVVADDCAAIVLAKQEVDGAAVQQLSACLGFIRDKELTGPAAELKGKTLLGYLAGKEVEASLGRGRALLQSCHLHNYRILLSSGKPRTPENGWVLTSM